MQLRNINKGIIFLPFIWILLLWTFVTLVSIKFGHFPSYGLPDPKEAGFYILYLLVFGGLGLIIFIMVISFVIQLITYCFERSLFSMKIFLAQLLSLAFLVLYLKLDLFNLMEWLID